ncbi:hypothetical protein AOX55_00006596 (plasmid) [Sinorhizobium fredii CCBAU 25509]|nr:hypothetical protein AOX55_00006596 [Sinorhizobium fredii CCBAU 25509]
MFVRWHGPYVERSTACLGCHAHCYSAERYLTPHLDLSQGGQILNHMRIDYDEVKRLSSLICFFTVGLSSNLTATVYPVAASN